MIAQTTKFWRSIIFSNLNVVMIILIKSSFYKFDFIGSIHQWIMLPISKKIVYHQYQDRPFIEKLKNDKASWSSNNDSLDYLYRHG